VAFGEPEKTFQLQNLELVKTQSDIVYATYTGAFVGPEFNNDTTWIPKNTLSWVSDSYGHEVNDFTPLNTKTWNFEFGNLKAGKLSSKSNGIQYCYRLANAFYSDVTFYGECKLETLDENVQAGNITFVKGCNYFGRVHEQNKITVFRFFYDCCESNYYDNTLKGNLTIQSGSTVKIMNDTGMQHGSTGGSSTSQEPIIADKYRNVTIEEDAIFYARNYGPILRLDAQEKFEAKKDSEIHLISTIANGMDNGAGADVFKSEPYSAIILTSDNGYGGNSSPQVLLDAPRFFDICNLYDTTHPAIYIDPNMQFYTGSDWDVKFTDTDVVGWSMPSKYDKIYDKNLGHVSILNFKGRSGDDLDVKTSDTDRDAPNATDSPYNPQYPNKFSKISTFKLSKQQRITTGFKTEGSLELSLDRDITDADTKAYATLDGHTKALDITEPEDYPDGLDYIGGGLANIDAGDYTVKLFDNLHKFIAEAKNDSNGKLIFDFGTNGFLEKENEISFEVYNKDGTPALDKDNNHLQGELAKVIDATPPEPVDKYKVEPIKVDTKVIRGSGCEPGAKVWYTVSQETGGSQVAMDSGFNAIETTVKADGTFELPKPYYDFILSFYKGAKVQIFLEDVLGNKQVESATNVEKIQHKDSHSSMNTNNNNTTRDTDRKLQDYIATVIIVDDENMELKVPSVISFDSRFTTDNSADWYIWEDDTRDVTKDKLAVIDERTQKTDWDLEAKLSNEFTSKDDKSKTLENARLFYYDNFNISDKTANRIEISTVGFNTVVKKGNNGTQVEKDLSSEWKIGKKGLCLFVQKSTGRQNLKGEYDCEITWQLSDTPSN
jgi:hypothetical protein